jgi:hypothetical protein
MKKERKIKRLSTPHHQMGEQRKIREEKTLSSVFMCLIFPERCIMCYSVYLYCQNAYNYDLWGRERKRYPQDHQFLGRLGILLASSIKLRIVLHIKQSKLPCSHFNFLSFMKTRFPQISFKKGVNQNYILQNHHWLSYLKYTCHLL